MASNVNIVKQDLLTKTFSENFMTFKKVLILMLNSMPVLEVPLACLS